MKYLRKFKNESEYQEFKASDVFMKPNVTLITDNKDVKFTFNSIFPLFLYPVGDSRYNQDEYAKFDEYAYELLGGLDAWEDGALFDAVLPTYAQVYYDGYLVRDISRCPESSQRLIFWEQSSGTKKRRYTASGHECICPM
jgi:hypothetical protein